MRAGAATAMRPRRTHLTDHVLSLPGGTEDSDLWVYELEDTDGMTMICSVWEPTPQERVKIAAGENIRLCIWGIRHPPVTIDLTDEPLGKSPGGH